MEGKPPIFRKEALDYYQLHRRQEGDVLRLAPRWTRWTYPLLMGLVGSALAFCMVGSVSEDASGPAFITREQRVHPTPPEMVAAALLAVSRPGPSVSRGLVLMSLPPESERQELARLRDEVDLGLVRAMEAPTSWVRRQQLRQAHEALDRALARAEARVLRAAVVGEAGVPLSWMGRSGSEAQPVASLMKEDARFSLVALLPARYRPLLRPGLRLHVTLDGFHHDTQEVPIESVEDAVVAPSDLQQWSGSPLGEANGPWVRVRARLSSRTFQDQGRSRDYFDGMPARVKVAVRSEPILLTLVPGLKGLLPHD